MIPQEVADIAQALRGLSMFIGYDRSVRWACAIYRYLDDNGWTIIQKARP